MLLGVGRSAVTQVKKRYFEGGINYALDEKARSGQPKEYTPEHEAEIIAQACTQPPKGSEARDGQ